MVIGKYVNRHYENEFIGNNPHVADTLSLKKNNKFESPYYGKGEYYLNYSTTGTQIMLTYGKGDFTDTINGKYIKVPNQESLSTSIERKYFVGNPKITLFKDLDQYYEKIE